MSTTYIIYSNIALAVLALCYKLLLSKDTNLIANRITLLSSPIIALILPYLSASSKLPIVHQLDTFLVSDSSFINLIIDKQQTLDNSLSFPFVYAALGLLMLIRLGYQVFTLFQTNPTFINEYKGIKVFELNSETETYSFWNKIYLSPNHKADHSVLLHEYAHIHQKHSLDRIFYGVIKALFWINPAVYYLNKEIRSNHEYSADQYAMDHTENQKEYVHTLTANALGTSTTILMANNFNTPSILAKRIAMLSRHNLKKTNIMKHLSFIPLTLLLVIAASVINPDSALAQSGDTSQMTSYPEFPGGNAAFQKYVFEECLSAVIPNNDVEGTVIVGFVINKRGKVTKVDIKKSLNPEIDAKAMKLFKGMPRWTPATRDGKPIDFQMALPIKFQKN